jgi:8-oxo-dGTP pyrophosphatase MutT (NUDIX family)
MNEPLEPLIPRPAATVMLIRDTPSGLSVFLMRRHSAMEFAAGSMVFPGGGVDDRDRHAPIAWAGPPPSWWAERFGIESDLAEALICAAARETFEESGVLFAGPTDDPDGIVRDASVYGDSRRALADRTLSFADFLRRENLVLRSDLLRPWANWVTPEAERTRRYDTYFFVGALPQGQRADGENTESDRAEWMLPQDAIADLDAAGRAGRPHRRRCAGRRAPDRAGAAPAGEAGRQLGVRVLRLRPLPPGTQSGWIHGLAAVRSG